MLLEVILPNLVGDVYCASLAGSYIDYINVKTGTVMILNPPTPDQGDSRISGAYSI